LLVGFSQSGVFMLPIAHAAQADITPPPAEFDNALAVSISPSKVKESNDFATQALMDPWDMTEFSDISRYLNESNVVQHLTNIQVANGVFSARSQSTDAQFYTIFPGYQSSIDSLNIPVLPGSLFPIDSAKYHCLYSRMKIETNPSDAMRIFWFADKFLGNGQFGVTKSIAIPSSAWQLYSIDLKTNFDSANSNTAWSNVAYWRGLRFDPTTLSGVNFAVDWVRLTDCTPINTNLSWTPVSGTMEIWAGIGAKTLDFKVGSVDGASGSSILDVQGWQAGSYYIGLKDSAGSVSWISQPLVVDGAPLVSFARPSFNTGVSYTWTMNTSSDLVTSTDQTRCVDYSFQNGMLNLVTQPAFNLPENCRHTTSWGAVASDPQLVLSMPSQKIDTSLYRYLTIRMNMDGMIQDINNGWHMRWLWKTYENNDPNKWCINVSNDIVIDPAWQTIMVDLHDGPSGTTEDWVGYGDCYSRHWTSNPAVWLRLDPNENTTSSTFNQIIDSITLSQVDSVTRGQLFPVQVQSNESFSNLNISLYYTTNRQVINQNQATIRTITAPPLAAHRIYLPFTLRNVNLSGGLNPNATVFYWDTTNVAAGTYYMCMEASDGLNKTSACSPAPLNVR
jgi:hypothetical protein